MQTNILANADKVLNSLAEYIVKKASKAIAERERFAIALSGGSSPKKLYELLASPAFRNRIEWDKTFFFFGDERYVPQTDADSNYLMVYNALFAPLDIEEANIFAVDTALSPEKAAIEYTNVIKVFFTEKEWRFDLVLLGLGDDAHTASLFPGTAVLHDTEPAVKENFLKNKQVYRITFNAPLINQARAIAFLVYGESKKTAVQQVMSGARKTELYPAQLIAPQNGEVQWFMDTAAAASL